MSAGARSAQVATYISLSVSSCPAAEDTLENDMWKYLTFRPTWRPEGKMIPVALKHIVLAGMFQLQVYHDQTGEKTVKSERKQEKRRRKHKPIQFIH